MSEFPYLCKTTNRHKCMKYDFDKDDSPSQVAEAAMAYGTQRSSVEERVDYMKSHLYSTTVQYLEQRDFMEDRPFPYDDTDESWFDESDEENPAMSNDIVLHDKEVWLHVS